MEKGCRFRDVCSFYKAYAHSLEAGPRRLTEKYCRDSLASEDCVRCRVLHIYDADLDQDIDPRGRPVPSAGLVSRDMRRDQGRDRGRAARAGASSPWPNPSLTGGDSEPPPSA